MNDDNAQPPRIPTAMVRPNAFHAARDFRIVRQNAANGNEAAMPVGRLYQLIEREAGMHMAVTAPAILNPYFNAHLGDVATALAAYEGAEKALEMGKDVSASMDDTDYRLTTAKMMFGAVADYAQKHNMPEASEQASLLQTLTQQAENCWHHHRVFTSDYIDYMNITPDQANRDAGLLAKQKAAKPHLDLDPVQLRRLMTADASPTRDALFFTPPLTHLAIAKAQAKSTVEATDTESVLRDTLIAAHDQLHHAFDTLQQRQIELQEQAASRSV